MYNGGMKHTVLVTGASGGIGAGIARAFAMDGHRVVIHYNENREKAEALQAELTARHLSAITAQADLTDEENVDGLVRRIDDAYGAPDVLVNNAGVALPQMLLTDCSAAAWDAVFCINVRGAFLVTKAVLPAMIAKRRGSIVNVSSMWGLTGGSCEVPYSAAKAALIGFTKALAKETALSNVRVNCIAPGFVATPMNAALDALSVQAIVEETPLLRAGTPEDIAATALFLASEGAGFITGQVLSVDGGRCI